MHVNKIHTLSKLEELGFLGSDVDLEISLFEYGLIWHKNENETTFIYPIHDYTVFDICTFSNDLNLKKEFDWINWNGFLSMAGMTFNEWNAYELGTKIQDLNSYYGYENIFGSSYWEGFKITR